MVRWTAWLALGCPSPPERPIGTEPSECAQAWYRDTDEDGYGTPSDAQTACEAPLGFVAAGTDCDDSAADVNPGALEVCDADDRDEDCDTLADDADPSATGQRLWWVDGDEDTFGGAEGPYRCDPAPGLASADGDCDDENAEVYPYAVEICGNGLDDDCSGDPGACALVGDVDAGDANWSVLGITVGEYTGHSLAGCGDLDGDGRDDLLVGSSAQNLGIGGVVSMFSYTSGGDQLRTAAEVLLQGAPGSHLGQQVECLPDVTFDGIGDLLVGSDTQAWVFSGASAQQEADAQFHFDSPGEYLSVATPVGDVTGDGIPDLAFGTQSFGDEPVGAVWLFAASAVGDHTPAEAVASVVGETPDEKLGFNVSGAIDLDGDGVDDLVTYAHDDGARTLSIFLGPVEGMLSSSAADGGLPPEGVELIGWSAANAGDSDGDGYDDLIVGSNTGVHAWLFAGPFTGATSATDAATATFTLGGGNASNDAFGRVGDLDLDGREEFAVTAAGTGKDAGKGYVAIFYAHPSGAVDAAADAELRLWGEAPDDRYGSFGARGVGDLDDDGAPDLGISGLPGSSGAVPGRVDVFFPNWP